MVKEKRKARLDKGEGGEFIGFGAFANTVPIAAPPTLAAQSISTASGGPSTSLSPIYTGSDASLNILFSRIGQKRDAITKSKALAELDAYFQEETHPKKVQAEALSHFLYLYQSKLSYDNTPRIRALSVQVCQHARERLPKAWNTLLCNSENKNSNNNNNVEIMGMLLCARADPASEVRVAANTFSEVLLNGSNDKESDEKTCLQCCHEGIWSYVQRMLSYNNPMAMHQDLFQKGASSSSSTPSLSEQQKEELEERYERIVGTAIEGLKVYFQDPSVVSYMNDIKTNKSANYTTPESTKFLWKMLSCNKTSLRRKTYALLSTTCQQLPWMIDVDKTSKLLNHSLSSEKESINISPLLETLLAFVATLPKTERSAAILQYVKPLTKLFKKGCYGAAASQWTPMVLPIVALLPNGLESVGSDQLPAQVNVLTCIWEGRSQVVGVADSFQVAQAVAETAAFLLQNQSKTPEPAFHQVIAKCWLQSLQAYLTTSESLTGPALQSHFELGKTLSQSIVQFDQTCNNKSQSAIAGIADFFWKQELPSIILQNNVQNKHLTNMLTNVQNQVSGEDTVPLLVPVLCQKFHAVLSPAQTKSNWVPKVEIYNLWIAILKLVPSNEIFPSNGPTTISLQSFVMNNILMWMVRHTSNASAEMSQNLASLDTRLFLALSIANKSAVSQWAAILREILAADPSLTILMECLAYMLKLGWKSAEVASPSDGAFDRFCIQVAEAAVARASEHVVHLKHSIDDDDSLSQGTAEIEDEKSLSTLHFLLFCVGLDRERKNDVLVGKEVMLAWCNATCPTDDSMVGNHGIDLNPVLDTLVRMVRADKMKQDDPLSVRVMVQSWRLGGRLWEEQVLPLLSLPANIELCSKVVQNAGQQSATELAKLSTESSFDEDTAWHWTCRAFRLLQLCGDEVSERLPLYSLSAIGMGSLPLWKSEPSPYMCRCILLLIKHVDPSKRWDLFEGSETNSSKLFLWVLIHLSGGGTTGLEADKARRRVDMAHQLFADVDLVVARTRELESCTLQCVDLLQMLMQESHQNEKLLGRAIAVFSMLVGASFAPITPAANQSSAATKLTISDLNVGDKAWYISHADDPSSKVECKIVKSHTDLPDDVYFTIQLNREGKIQERQTLAERLRKHESDGDAAPVEGNLDFVPVESLSKDERLARDKVANLIVNNLLTPFYGSMKPICYELYNILITQCGLVGGRGVGSLHYAVLQQLLQIQKGLQNCLTDAETICQDMTSSLLRLGLALGSGVNVPSSQFGVPLLGLDAASLLPDLLKLYDDETNEPSAQQDRAVATFLAISVPVAEDQALRNLGFSTLFQAAARLLSGGKVGFNASDYLALRTMEIGQIESHKYREGESILQDSEAEAITALVKAFSLKWGLPVETDPLKRCFGTETWYSVPVFEQVMTGTLEQRPQLIANSSRQYIDKLVGCLYRPIKRIHAMRMLNAYAENCRPLYDNDSDEEIINPLTLELLDNWSKGLLKEEAEELEDDVGLVAEWVCAQQMNDMESWHDDDKIDDDVAYGRMLSWLFFLQLVDAAAAKDSVNRPSFLAYVSRSDAVNAILDLAMVYGNVGSGRKYKFDDVIPLSTMLTRPGATLEISKLAALVMFRTVEVFPTLSKTWWEMNCPGKQTGTVQAFVESHVSPQVLKTALESIQHATAFGQMQVKGSSSTGEITATYVQDDLTLSVVIQMPNSFPFRRAEVDCSKTFGIPPARSKRWALMITQMINNQGGTLKDALLLWKENIDKEFEGVEPCPVCYSVLHVKSHKLPNLECNTCHNQFHHECLKEWFNSSNKNSCVICQQPWQGTKI
jgi:hypothetical protein